jgi:hypothetical protein
MGDKGNRRDESQSRHERPRLQMSETAIMAFNHIRIWSGVNEKP